VPKKLATKIAIRKKWAETPIEKRTVLDNQSQLVCDAIRNTEEFHGARRIALFAARLTEIDLKSLWELRPGDCVFPKVSPRKKTMRFYHVDRWEDLVEGFKGILEPKGKGRPATPWLEKDLVLVPGIAFDVTGARVGSGLGYYDRFLSTEGKLARKWGVCTTRQISKTRLEQEESDVRMDALVTEMGWALAKDALG
jgi:5-formyltetrahydrofolate cyclo-ligase